MPPENLENANDSRYQVHQDVLGGPTTNTGLQRSLPNLTQSLAIPSSKATTAHIPFLDRLRALPEVRPIPWRPGQELGPEKSTESPRVQQRGAILLSTRGHPPENPCASCAAGNGRFSVCVTLEPWFQGACSSCIFTSKGNKCSLRSQTSGNADGRALRYHNDNPEVLQSFTRQAAENPSPVKKRKRLSAPAEPSLGTSYSTSSPQTGETLPNSPDLDTLLQAQIALEQEPQKTKQKRQSKSLPNAPRSSATGPRSHKNVANLITSSSASRQGDAIQNDGAQVLNEQKPYAPMKHTYQHSSSAAAISLPVIDTFPKAKRRQVYAFVSGLQSGIQNLQKDLDSLRSLLGIDEDEPMSSY